MSKNYYQIKVLTMMKNCDQSVEINLYLTWPDIPNHAYKILIIEDSGSGKTNVLLDLIKHQRLDINKIYLYVKGSFKQKYQLLINEREKVGIENLKESKSIY